MRKTKFLASVLLASVMLSACGGDSKPTDSADSASVAETEKETEASTEEAKEEKQALSIAEQKIWEQDGLSVTVTGISTDGLIGPELNLLIENNSDKNVTVQSRYTAINGCMVSSTMSADAAAGKKANDSLDFSETDLKRNGIDTIANIEFSLHIFDPDTYDTRYDSELIKLSTNLAEGFSQTYDDSGEVIYDENGIKIVYQGVNSDDSIFGPEAVLYIENNTEQTITVQSRDTSVNGFMMDPAFSPEITPGNKIVSGMTFMSSDLEANNVTDFETIETSFHIFNENYDSVVDTEPITITVK